MISEGGKLTIGLAVTIPSLPSTMVLAAGVASSQGLSTHWFVTSISFHLKELIADKEGFKGFRRKHGLSK